MSYSEAEPVTAEFCAVLRMIRNSKTPVPPSWPGWRSEP
jgi:hypothetical protein